jgi:hypothetical protein
VFGEDIAFYIDAVSGFPHVKVRRFPRVGNYGYGHQAVADTGDCEADPIDTYRTLVNQEAIEVFGDLHLQHIVFERLKNSDSIDMALHDVAAQARRRSHGAFEIHRIAGFQVAEVGHSQGFGGKVGGEAVAADLDCGETNTVDGDTGARCQVSEYQTAAY